MEQFLGFFVVGIINCFGGWGVKSFVFLKIASLPPAAIAIDSIIVLSDNYPTIIIQFTYNHPTIILQFSYSHQSQSSYHNITTLILESVLHLIYTCPIIYLQSTIIIQLSYSCHTIDMSWLIWVFWKSRLFWVSKYQTLCLSTISPTTVLRKCH